MEQSCAEIIVAREISKTNRLMRFWEGDMFGRFLDEAQFRYKILSNGHLDNWV